MGTTAILQPRDVLVLLDELGDDALCAVIAHAQGILLDRPIPPCRSSSLAVEVVGPDEGRLLALYRSLTPPAQRALLTSVWRRTHAPPHQTYRLRTSVGACPTSWSDENHSVDAAWAVHSRTGELRRDGPVLTITDNGQAVAGDAPPGTEPASMYVL